MTTATNIIFCRYCNGERETTEYHCTGCGAPIANARVNVALKPKPPAKCPRCKSNGPHTSLESGRHCCGECRAVWEDDDVGFLDTRPEVNAEKRERQRSRKRGRR